MHIIFLPGGGGSAEFWKPVGALLPSDWIKTYLAWPGLGDQAHDPTVNGFDDLVALAVEKIRGPAVLVAQSMGGIVGIRLALKYPQNISHLVLVATSGGMDVASLGGAEWRPAYLSSFPDGARWITTDMPDHTADIPAIKCPALLIWGDRDPISPIAVGMHLCSILKSAELHVIRGGDHNLGRERASEVAALIVSHLANNAS